MADTTAKERAIARIDHAILDLAAARRLLVGRAPTDPAWTFEPLTIADWDDALPEPGTIECPTPGEFVFTVPASATSGHRAELQASQAYKGGGMLPCQHRYRWQFMIPADSDLPTGSGGFLHIAQFKTDEPCYTGGLRIVDNAITLHTRGGERTRDGGGCAFAYDAEVELGALDRDRQHQIDLDATWAVEGRVIATLDARQPVVAEGPVVGELAKAMKFRIGLYRGAKPDGGPTTMRARQFRAG